MSDKFREMYLQDFPDLRWTQLAHQAWMDYDAIATANEDPCCPQRPKYGRERFEQTWRRVVGEAFQQATLSGFKGDWAMWEKEVKRAGAQEARERK